VINVIAGGNVVVVLDSPINKMTVVNGLGGNGLRFWVCIDTIHTRVRGETDIRIIRISE